MFSNSILRIVAGACPNAGRQTCAPAKNTIARAHVLGSIVLSLLLNVLSDVAKKVGPIHVALEIRSDAFCHARNRWVRIRTWIGNKGFYGTVFGASDSNASLRAQVVGITSLWQCKLSRV